MHLRQIDVITPLNVSDGSNLLADLPVKPFRKYVQRAWNSFDVIKGWTGELPDMELLAEQMSTSSFDDMPVPFKPKRDAPVKNMHILVAPSIDNPDAVDIVKFMTFNEAIGYKILGSVCHGECLQLDIPEGGVRSKAARIALHRFLLNVNGTHLTPFTLDDNIPDVGDGEGPKRKILSHEEVDAGFDLVREVLLG